MGNNDEKKDLIQLSEEEILNILLGAGQKEPPQRGGTIKRLGLPFILKGIPEQIDSIREQCTINEKVDAELLDLKLIAAASVKPNWNDPKLIEHYKASGPDQVIKRVLYKGEIAQLVYIVLELSSIGEGALEIVKN